VKKWIIGTLMYPVFITIGWVCTKFSERYEETLHLALGDDLDWEDEKC